MDAGLPIPRLPASAERLLLPAAALLWLERAWARHLKWVAVAATLWLALALMGLAEAIPGALRVSLLFGLGLGCVGALVLSFRDVALPGRAEALRRLEQASGSRRGQLALLDERAVDLSDPTTALLWARARAEATPARLRLGRPRLTLDDAERYGLLPLLATGLLIGALIAKGDAPARIAAGFSPYAVSLADLRVTATIAPPAYASAAPRTLSFGPGDQAITALKGSRLTLRLAAPAGDWQLVGPGVAQPVKDGRVAVTLAAEGRYVLQLGKRQAVRLDTRFAGDAVPSIDFDGVPQAAPTGALRIGWTARDDHGAMAVSLEMRRGGALRRIALDGASGNGKGAAFADLTADPFAGEVVTLRLLARDGGGQTGQSPVLRLQLPERRFLHPVAQAVIAVRKSLIRDPGARAAAGERLTDIAAEPGRYAGDLAVFAGLRSAAMRLAYDTDDTRALSVIRLLWDIAVDLEDRGASRAMADMRSAMDELAQRIGSASDSDMAAMLDRLTAGMGDYLRRQVEAMQAQPGAPGATGEGASLDLSFLDAMMQDLRDRLAAGDKAGAQAALANLRRLMESLQFGGAGDPAMAKQAQAAAQAAAAARDLEARERDLQADTIAESVQRAVSGRAGAMDAQAEAQRELEAALRAVRQQARDAGLQPPPGLARAAQAMEASRAALARGQPGDAMLAQQQAVEALGEAAGALEGQAQAMGRAAGGAMAAQPGAPGSGVDPLGRPGSGFGQGLVKLPDEERMRRVQQIRRLLEERAADPARSEEERAYYLRLLKRF
jgi:hypothetical protein